MKAIAIFTFKQPAELRLVISYFLCSIWTGIFYRSKSRSLCTSWSLLDRTVRQFLTLIVEKWRKMSLLKIKGKKPLIVSMSSYTLVNVPNVHSVAYVARHWQIHLIAGSKIPTLPQPGKV